jgi:hypothetical protein
MSNNYVNFDVMNTENKDNTLINKDLNNSEENQIQGNSNLSENPIDAKDTMESSVKDEANSIKTQDVSENQEDMLKYETETAQNEASSELTESKEIDMNEKTSSDLNNTLEKDETPEEENKSNQPIDYSTFSKQELLENLKDIIQNEDVETSRVNVESIKARFYKIRNAELSELKKLHFESGKDIADFVPPRDEDEVYLKELLSDYKQKKADFLSELEKEKNENLKRKEAIIEKIKVLANGEESLQKTFEEFRELQKEWKEIGVVPKESVKSLWSNYNLQIERFYDFIKINNELRDLDFKKNLEAKIEICEKAEKLLLEPKIVNAYKLLQEYHDLWREIGPVPQEKRDEIWERFSLASREINKKHQEYFLEKKEERENNLNAKIALCEKAEIIANENYEAIKDWNDKTNEILEIQKVWKTIGMVPQKQNNEIYDRFRTACNLFFEKKQDFFSIRKSEFDDNLQKKLDLCIQAEALQNDTNWNNTRDQIMKLQEEWKAIGPIPKKQSDEVWKRFRKACDTFFSTRVSHFKQRKEEEKGNLEKKLKIIENIKHFKASEEKTENLKALQEFQNEWTKIGFVPKRDKEKLQTEYKQALEKAFEGIDMSLSSLNNSQFEKQVEDWIKVKDESKIQSERQKINTKISKIKEDIVLWENNMSFFTGSSSESLLKDVKKKIQKSTKETDNLKEKRKILDIALRNLKQENE